jgi:transposase
VSPQRAHLIIGQHGAIKRQGKSSPVASPEIKARAAELNAEKPGDLTRISVRIFREYGIRYSNKAVRSWLS